MKKSIFKVIAFGVVFIVLMKAFFSVFNFKSNDGPYQMMKFYEERDNSIDVIFLGSSHMFSNANTSVLWDEYGIAAYDLGGSVQPYWNTYYYLKEAFKTQSPKAVVWDVYTAAMYKDLDYAAYEYVIKNTYGMKLSRNKIDAINASVVEGNRECYYFEYPTFHKRYTDLKKSDFHYDYDGDYKDINCWKGQMVYMQSAHSNPGRPSDDMRFDDCIGELSEKHEKYLRMIIDLCEENDAKLILTLNPYSLYEGDMPIINRVAQIADETGTDFINFNLYYDEIGLDFENDYSDECHMYYTGSEKFTRFMAECIESRVAIPDRREEEGYGSYNDMVKAYKQAIYEIENGEEL